MGRGRGQTKLGVGEFRGAGERHGIGAGRGAKGRMEGIVNRVERERDRVAHGRTKKSERATKG